MKTAARETKQQPQENATRDYFDYAAINIPLSYTDSGVMQLVPIAFKFEEPGQRLIGVYMGNTPCVSAFDESKTFLYHKVWLPTGHIVGFHGSVQLDGAISTLPPNKYEIDIEYEDAESISKTKRLKHFSIAARLIVKNNYPQLTDVRPTFDKPSDLPF